MNLLQTPAKGTSTGKLPSAARIDALIAPTLRGETVDYPFPAECDDAVAARCVYHGLAGLLAATALPDWPPRVRERLMAEARAASMWEMRHQLVVAQLIEALAAQGVRSILLKGTALAYHVYDRPAERSRGDTDLLIEYDQLETARAVLRSLGYARTSSDEKLHEDLQEMWFIAHPDGSRHEIDLHWQVIDALALGSILPVSECFAGARPLPAVSPSALRLSDAAALVHACVHRMKHLSSPYYSGAEVHYSADRLIWSCDIDRLAKRLTANSGWDALLDMAARYEVMPILGSGLLAASRDLGTPVPAIVQNRLTEPGHDSFSSRHLQHRSPLVRGLENLLALPGIKAKGAYLWRRLFPGEVYVRLKYPAMAEAALPRLYLRRIREAVIRRKD